MTDTPFHSGYAAIIGRPNVGKSTLVNALLKQKIAAVSPRPQTTQRRQLGILTLPQAQIILVDTPGIHQPHHKLGTYMNEVASDALQDADCIVWLVDVSEPPQEEDRIIASQLTSLAHMPACILVLNKSDLVSFHILEERRLEFQALLPKATPMALSATQEGSLQPLLDRIIENLPAGDPFYDEDQITDLYERDIAADLIREACLLHLSDEVPHAIAVRIDEFKDRSETQSYVAATIFVERESHKGIVIGQGGSMLKKIGTTARTAIEEMTGRKVYLELRVKLDKNWRDNPDALQRLGYTLPQEGNGKG